MTAWAAQLRPAGQVRSTSEAAAPCRAWEAHEQRGPAGGEGRAPLEVDFN